MTQLRRRLDHRCILAIAYATFWATLKRWNSRILFSKPVPIDQENETRAQELEIGATGFGVRGVEHARREIERRASGEHRGLVALPVHAMRLQHVLKEGEPFQMNVRVGYAHGEALDMNDDYMGVSRADIVLDNEPSVGVRRRGRQTGCVIASASRCD